jgi:hypothetical protein
MSPAQTPIRALLRETAGRIPLSREFYAALEAAQRADATRLVAAADQTAAYLAALALYD